MLEVNLSSMKDELLCGSDIHLIKNCNELMKLVENTVEIINETKKVGFLCTFKEISNCLVINQTFLPLL